VELTEQRLSFFQIPCVEAFGEPAIYRSEQIVGLIPLALIAPEASEAGGSAQRGEGKARQPTQVTGNQFTINATDVLYSAMPQ